MIEVTVEDVLIQHDEIIKKYGGIPDLRDIKLLESAVKTPFQSFNGIDFYKTDIEKAAALCRGLIKNHPFVDGNKRIGIVVMFNYLDDVGININATNQDVIELGLSVAKDKDLDYIINWIKDKID